MIYLQNITDPQEVFVPKDGAASGGDLVFRAKSTIDLDTKIDQPVTDLQTSALYFNIEVTIPEGLPDGEYEYTLLSGGIPVSSGLLVIGENFGAEQYEKDIKYEQYETE